MTEYDKKIWLFGVFTACPLSDGIKDCLFQKYRSMSPATRWSYLESLSEKEVDDFIKYHKKCLSHRISGKRKECSFRLKDKKIISK